MATLPDAIQSFIDENKGIELTFKGAIETYDNEEHTVRFSVADAVSVLSGEDDFDDERYAGIGFLNDDLPLFVDVSRKPHPVHVLADGEPVLVHKAFETFAKKLARPKPPKPRAGAKAAKASTPVGPKETLPGPASVDWPTDAVVAFELGNAEGGRDFLWFGYNGVKPKTNHELALRYVYPQGHRTTFAVGAKWDVKAKMKMDRGTGVWLDFARYDRATPVVMPRVKALLEAIQPEGLEFLAVKAEVGGEKADVFLLNVLQAVSCLDVEASGLTTPYREYPYRQQHPHELVFVQDRLPSAPCFFRVAEYPELLLATQAMVERLRQERLSGIQFVPTSQSQYKKR